MNEPVDFEKRRRDAAKQMNVRPADIRAEIRALQPGSYLNGMAPGFGKPALEDDTNLPPECPVIPLGRDGDVFYFINAAGGLGELTPSSSGKGHIDALFAGQWPYLIWAWGRVRYSDKGEPKPLDNYDAEIVRRHLFEAATLKGPWNAVDMVRGRGAWIGANDELILHLGNRLLIDGKDVEPLGERDGFLYPGRPALPGPEEGAQPAGPEAGGSRLLDTLKSWNWSRSEIDPFLMLGWITAAMVGGALDWRPTIFVTGDAATGKSTLQRFVGGALNNAIVQAVETTAAGVYQVLKNDTMAVAVDELEGASDNRKARSVIELARVANSGGRMLRGGQDHNGRQFDLRSPFFFSAINAPGLQSQDRSRMAMLHLKPLEQMEGGEPIDFSEVGLWGRQVLRRVLDWWPRMKELRARVRQALMTEGGHDGRGADTFGTLIAFAWAAVSDDMIDDAELFRWADRLRASGLSEFEGRTPNWKLCLRHLLQVRPDALRQVSEKTVGRLLMQFVPGEHNENQPCDPSWLKGKLAEVGLGLSGPKAGNKRDYRLYWLFVPNDHSSLTPLFDGVKWQAEAGAPGTWTDALRQSPEWDDTKKEGLHRQGNGRVGLTPLRGTLLRLDGLFEALGDTAMDGVDALENVET